MADTFREALLKLKRDVVFPWNVSRYEEPKLPKKPSYFNRFDLDRLDQIAKLAVYDTLQHVPGYITSGFKELRLFNLNAYQYNVSVNFLDQWLTLFPKTAIIFGYREKDIMKSAWWKEGDKEWTAKLLTQQLEWFKSFHAEIRSGKRYGPEGSVVKSDAIDSAMVEFEELLSCNNEEGSGLRDVYDMLGEKLDVEKCKLIMDNNVEDMGLAASESSFNGQQVGCFLTSDGSAGTDVCAVPGIQKLDLRLPETQRRQTIRLYPRQPDPPHPRLPHRARILRPQSRRPKLHHPPKLPTPRDPR
jgi:hypothetical protein